MTAAWIVQGDARRLPLPDRSVQCVVTSPPYFGLRSYGGLASIWGGDPACTHSLEDGPARRPMTGGTGAASAKQVTNAGSQFGNAWAMVHPPGYRSSDPNPGALQHPGNTNRERFASAVCTRCGAWAGELGLEPTPGAYVAHLVEVLVELWRVLRNDGVVFLNIGDSYGSTAPGTRNSPQPKGSRTNAEEWANHRPELSGAMKPKSLMLIPERLAIALADEGWIIRSRIAWCKAAPMPESVKDRPTSAWEHVWVLTKQGRYYWDHEAVKQPTGVWLKSDHRYGAGSNGRDRHGESWMDQAPLDGPHRGFKETDYTSGRNLWNYWVLPPDPYPGAHFATFPREIPRRCIAAASREGDLILDPFSGSGTVAYQAARMGRRGLGVELSAEYLEQTRATRLAQRFLPL